ncbi:MAG: hypothetical protein JEY91_15485, partial [Spirochaetaceae bacterium]|nr:hypothetical protein [Spirochaetaceae bacterium]
PVTARVDVVKDKLSLIGGYVLKNIVKSVYTENAAPSSTSETVYTYTTSTGTDVTPVPVATSTIDGTDTTITSTEYTTEAEWTGQMNFMIRWQPMEEMTVDFFGQSIITALDFNLFGSRSTAPLATDGFNASRIIDNLGMSVSFHF